MKVDSTNIWISIWFEDFWGCEITVHCVTLELAFTGSCFVLVSWFLWMFLLLWICFCGWYSVMFLLLFWVEPWSWLWNHESLVLVFCGCFLLRRTWSHGRTVWVGCWGWEMPKSAQSTWFLTACVWSVNCVNLELWFMLRGGFWIYELCQIVGLELQFKLWTGFNMPIFGNLLEWLNSTSDQLGWGCLWPYWNAETALLLVMSLLNWRQAMDWFLLTLDGSWYMA